MRFWHNILCALYKAHKKCGFLPSGICIQEAFGLPLNDHDSWCNCKFYCEDLPTGVMGGGARRSKPVTKLVDATVCKWNVSFQMILSFLNSALLSFVMLQHLAFYFYNFVFFVRFVKLLKNSTKRSTLSPYLFTFVWYVLYDERCLCCPHSILPSWASMLVLFILKMRKWPLRISPFCRLMTV